MSIKMNSWYISAIQIASTSILIRIRDGLIKTECSVFLPTLSYGEPKENLLKILNFTTVDFDPFSVEHFDFFLY